MKVLFYGSEYPPVGGGVGAYMKLMAEALVSAGHEALVVCTGESAATPVSMENGVQVHRVIPVAETGRRSAAMRVLALAKSEAVDWIEGGDLDGVCAPVLELPSRPPVVIKVHGCESVNVLRESHVYAWWQHLTIGISRLMSASKSAREWTCLRQCDLLLSPSVAMMHALEQQGLPMPESRAVVPNPLTLSEPVVRDEAEVPTILMVGRIDVGKGIQYIPDYIDRIRRKIPDVRLIIAGADTYARGLGSLEARLRNWLGADRQSAVEFVGRQDRDGLAALYRSAWMLVSLSRWDNFPTVLLEAASYELPVVGSIHGGAGEMLENSACRACDPADGSAADESVRLLQLSREERAEAGRSVLEAMRSRFDPGAVADEYVAKVSTMLAVEGAR